MLDAGLAVSRALEALSEQCTSGAIRRALPLIWAHVAEGGTTADAFALFPRLFPSVHLAMIRAAEAGGRLAETLERLSRACHRRSAVTGPFVTALVYPFLLLHLAFFAVPLIQHVLDDSRPYWRVVLAQLGVFYGVLILVVVVPRVMRVFPSTALVLDALKDCVPGWSGVASRLALSRAARTLDGLYRSGMTLAEALPEAAGASGNELVRRRVLRLAPLVRGGEALSQAMKAVGGFPLAFVNMVATGEESGRLSDMLSNTAGYYEEEAQTAVRRFAVVASVVIYVAVAATVGYQIVHAYVSVMERSFHGIENLPR